MILLDTCAIIWDALDSNKLSSKAFKALNNTNNDLALCDISFWEISMLIKKRRLDVDGSAKELLEAILQARNFDIQKITPPIAELSVNLGEEINNDPADRLIVATSIILNAPLITADKNLQNSSLVEIIW